MALDPQGNKGVARAPMPARDAPSCMICRDGGLYVHDGEYRVCMAPHTEGHRRELQKEADEANESLRLLEKRTNAK